VKKIKYEMEYDYVLLNGRNKGEEFYKLLPQKTSFQSGLELELHCRAVKGHLKMSRGIL
jgi:hypothetical protein